MHRSSPAATSHVLDPCLFSCCFLVWEPTASDRLLYLPKGLSFALSATVTPVKLPFGILRVSGSAVFCRIGTDDDPVLLWALWFLGH